MKTDDFNREIFLRFFREGFLCGMSSVRYTTFIDNEDRDRQLNEDFEKLFKEYLAVIEKPSGKEIFTKRNKDKSF